VPIVIYILRDLPYFDQETTVAIPTGEAAIRAFQIIVWVSVTPEDVLDLDKPTPRFPAVLDTGNNHNFSLREEHLLSWAGASPRGHLRLGQVSVE